MRNSLNKTKEILKLERFKKWYRFHIEINDGRNDIFTIKMHKHALTERGATTKIHKSLTGNYRILKVEVIDDVLRT